MRKHLRGRRLASVKQLGFDRVVHFQFGSDFESDESRQEHEFHLYLELFAQGNIILTDWEHRILALLRPVELVAEGKKLAIGQIYEPSAYDLPDDCNPASFNDWDVKSMSRGILAAFSPQMIEYCLEAAGLSAKKTSIVPESGREAFCFAVNKLAFEIRQGKSFAGFISLNPSSLTPAELLKPEIEAELLSFSPLDFVSSWLRYSDSFNDAVDIYYSRLEAQKTLQRLKNSESEAERKLAAIQAEQQARISGLQASIELLLRKAQAVEANAEQVEAALLVARTALDSGMDWTDFGRLIESEKKSSNQKRAEVAALFFGLKLESGQVTLRLEDDLNVDVVVNDSAFGNASRLYELRSQAKSKMERTIAVNEAAMKSAAAKIRSEAAATRKMGRVRQLQSLRKPFWFEKFSWFVSSEGFLVLAGRDAQQNELLVKRHLRQGDVYVHADVHGAGSIVVKNHLYPTLALPPPKTLHEAGNFSICASRAWEAKIVTSAWWVRAEQVSKTAPSGEYLGTGSFMIRGTKNFLPPMQLSLSFGFVFVVDEEARAAKKAERIALEQAKEFAAENEILFGEKYRVEEMTHAVDVMIIDTASRDSAEPKQPVKSKSKKKKQEALPVEAVKEKSENKGPVRGKKGKEKKIKKKYANQDEEERELRMQLLGSVKKEEPKREEPKKKTEPKAPKQPVTKVELGKADPAEEPEEAEDETAGGEFIAADYFTLTPEDDKEYLYALPVCYPTSAFTSARFRVKLIPGALKKGKAVKSAVSLLTEASSCPSQHLRDLMRAVPENELLAVMPAKVALGVSAHETSKLKKKSKKK